MTNSIKKYNNDVDSINEAFGKITASYHANDPGTNKSFRDNQRGSGSNLLHVTPRSIQPILLNCFDTKRSIFIYGDPGIGKSSVVYQAAKSISTSFPRIPDNDDNQTSKTRTFVAWDDTSPEEKKLIQNFPGRYFVFIDLRVASMEPDAFMGIVVKIEQGAKSLERTPDDWAYVCGQPNAAGVLFLDELNQGDSQVMKAVFKLILDRGITSAGRFPDGIKLAAAGNRTAFNSVLPHAIANRLALLVLEPDLSEWIEDYARHNQIDEDLIAFLRTGERHSGEVNQLFYKLPDDDREGDAFPTPRSIEFVNTAIIAYHARFDKMTSAERKSADNIYETLFTLASISCGKPWASQFVDYLMESSAFKWDELVQNPSKFFPSRDSHDNKAVDYVTKVQRAVHQVVPHVTDILGKNSRFVKGIDFDTWSKNPELVKFVQEIVNLHDHFKNMSSVELQMQILAGIYQNDKNAFINFESIIQQNRHTNKRFEDWFKADTGDHDVLVALTSGDSAKLKTIAVHKASTRKSVKNP